MSLSDITFDDSAFFAYLLTFFGFYFSLLVYFGFHPLSFTLCAFVRKFSVVLPKTG